MRHHPGETLADAADVLREQVAPLLPAASRAAAALAEVLARLEQLEATWDRALPFVLAQNARLRELLGEAPVAEEGARFAEAFAENTRLNGALAAELERAEDARAEELRRFLLEATEEEAAVTGTDLSRMLPF